MKIVWDEPKRLANLDKHGLDFDWAHAVIEGDRDRRFKAISYFVDGAAVVIYAALGSEAISIISFRPASAKERRRLHG
ncbi:BrnT family toxin [Aquamicrobium sp. LC103]|uniref:BrnT family toxin n=1 Tax=Aquamicrobium sp. LC103 TaxID=1120658 RepID=UPI00063EC775|nr:BrnT family toxin [Aquamicrobium sp. LC103]TKT80951.1 hypothetical protein XW59_003460 [Aquamicrobium sp. LC103]